MREKSPIGDANSSDPLIEDANQIPVHAQSNTQDSQKKHRRDSIQDSENGLDDQKSQEKPRKYSQTYDGVFSNLTARPEVMVLPKGDPLLEDAPPVLSL